MKKIDFPYVIRHVYDVDAFELLDAMKAKMMSEDIIDWTNQFEILQEVEKALIKEAENDNLDLSENLKYRNFVLPSSSILYHTFLTYKLITFDLYKIEPMLSFQSKLFLGNYYAVKGNFVGLVEYTAYESVKNSMFSDKNLRLEKIVNWVEGKRKDYSSSSYFKSSEVENKFIKADGEFLDLLHQKLMPFFKIEQEKSFLRDALFLGDVEGELSFDGHANQFIEFFKRLKYNNLIFYTANKDLSQWICLNFKFNNVKTKSFENFLNDSVLQILKNSSKEARKGSRILLEVAQYIMAKERKDKRVIRAKS